MIISKRMMTIMADKIGVKCQGQEHLEIEIEVTTPYHSYFVDFEFTDKVAYQEIETGAWIGAIDLTIHSVKVFDNDATGLEVENLQEVLNTLTEKNSY